MVTVKRSILVTVPHRHGVFTFAPLPEPFQQWEPAGRRGLWGQTGKETVKTLE